MNSLLRDIFQSAKRDPELQCTLQIEALLHRDSGEEDKVFEIGAPSLAVYHRETLNRLESIPYPSEEDQIPLVMQIPSLVQSLQTYRFIDDIDELRIGRYTRWICNVLPDPAYMHQYKPPKLSCGGVLYNISFDDNGVCLHVYSIYTKRTIKYRFDNMLTFQKFNEPELALLVARA